MNDKALQPLTLTTVAARIDAHLQRFERDPKLNKLDAKYGTRDYFGAGAGVAGARVAVCYVSYQGSSNLTREEALSYLAGLDGGYVGRHFEWLRRHPVPVANDEVRYHVLLTGGRGQFCLYAVTKMTATRVYGRRVAGNYYAQSFAPRGEVFKRQATAADLDAVLALALERDKAIDAVNADYAVRLAALRGTAGDDDKGEDA